VPTQRITADQLRAARALLHLGQQELSERSGVSVPTIKRLEGGSGVLRAAYDTVIALARALEEAGAEFTEGNGAGPGVRFKKPTSQQADNGDRKPASRARRSDGDTELAPVASF
jgi:transcriptional regulator with XRE-family HTH domain